MFENFLETVVFVLPACLVAIMFHELAHGFTSYLLGDPTPKEEGRLSFNPVKHLDPIGTISLLIFHFGWAKPIHVNMEYYKHKRLGMILVALAGPLANFIIGFIGIFLMGIVIKSTNFNLNSFTEYLYNLFFYLFIINIGLGIFNLIPIPPLDGSKIFTALLSEESRNIILKYEQYFSIVLIILLFTGLLDAPFSFFVNHVYDFYYTIVSFILKI